MSPESPWNREKLERVTQVLKCHDIIEWPRICSELNIRKGTPRFLVKGARYDDPSKSTASSYDFSELPWHDEVRDVVIINNPFPIIVAVLNKEYANADFPIHGPFIEMDAMTAMKLLVLGAPRTCGREKD